MEKQNDTIVYTNYHHEGIDNYLASWKKQTSSEVQLKAKTNAGKKLPKAIGDDFKRYIGYFKEKAQECLRDIDRILKITPVLFKIKQLRDKRDEIVFKANRRKEELESKSVSLNPDANHAEHKLVKAGSIIALLILVLLSTAETFLSYKPFYYLTGNKVSTWTICIVFAILWIIGAEKFSKFFKDAEVPRRTIKRIFIIIACTFVFYSIAHLRVLEKACSRAILNEEPIPSFFAINYTEALILTGIGWVFFIGGVWVSQKSPSIQEVRQALIQRFNRRKALKIQKEILLLQAEIDAENEKIAKEEHAAISLLNIRKQAIKEVVGYLEFLCEEYKEVNYSSRVDGVYPDCFNEKVTFDMDTIVPNIKEDLEFQMDNANASKLK